jgi:TolA-binding protein
MARDIGRGYLLITDRVLLRLTPAQVDRLVFELEKQLRAVRGEQPDLSDIEALRQRNQMIQRLTGARRIVEGVRQRRRK